VRLFDNNNVIIENCMLFCAKIFISYCTRHAALARTKLCQSLHIALKSAVYFASEAIREKKSCDGSSFAQDAINGKLYAIINLTIKAGTATVEP
jgi:hypothetical protein